MAEHDSAATEGAFNYGSEQFRSDNKVPDYESDSLSPTRYGQRRNMKTITLDKIQAVSTKRVFKDHATAIGVFAAAECQRAQLR